MTNESNFLPHGTVPRGRHYNSLQRDIARHHKHAWDQTQDAGELLLHDNLPDAGTLTHADIEARLQNLYQGREIGAAADWPLLTIHGKWTPDGAPRPFVPDWVPENLQARLWGRIGTHRYTTEYDQINSNTWCWVDFRDDTLHETPLLAEQVESAGLIPALPVFFKITPVATSLEDALAPFTGLIAKRPSTVHEGVQPVMDRFGMYVMMSTADMYGNALHGVMGVGYGNTRQPSPSFFWSVVYRTSALAVRLLPISEPAVTRSYTGFTHTTVSPERARLESSRPTIPENVMVVTDANRVTLTWTYNEDLIPVNGWLVSVFISGATESFRYENTVREFTRVLPWGAVYTMHLQGWNRNGNGVPFIVQDVISPNPGMVPGMVSDFTATIDVDALSFTLTWTAAAGTVTGYSIEYFSDSNLIHDGDTTETTFTVLNVERSVYRARVAAYNDDGVGLWSAYLVLDINIGAVLTDVPGPVTNLRQDVDQTTDSQIVWTWVLPAGIFDAVRVETGPNGISFPAGENLANTATSYIWRGNGVQYIRVAARNAVGLAVWVTVMGISHQAQETYHQRLDTFVYANSALSPIGTIRPTIAGVDEDNLRAWAHSLSYFVDDERHIAPVNNFRIGGKNAVTTYRPAGSMSGGRALASNAITSSNWSINSTTGVLSLSALELRSLTPYVQEGGIALTVAFRRSGNQVTPYILVHGLHISGLRPTILPYSIRTQADELPGHGVAAASFFEDVDNISREVFHANTDLVLGTNSISLTFTFSPLPTGYSNGFLVAFIARNTSTGNVSVNVHNFGSRALYYENGTRVSAGDIQAGDRYVIEYYQNLLYLRISDFGNYGTTRTYAGVGQAALHDGLLPGAAGQGLAYHASALCGPASSSNVTIELGGSGTNNHTRSSMTSGPLWRDNRWWVDDAGISTLRDNWGDAGASRLPTAIPEGYRPTQNITINPGSTNLPQLLSFRRSRAWLGLRGSPSSSDIGIPSGYQASYFMDSKAGRDLFGWDQWTDFPISPGNININGMLTAAGAVSFSRIWLTQVPHRTWYTAYETPTAEADTIDTYVINNYQSGDSIATGDAARRVQPPLFDHSFLAPRLEDSTNVRYPMNERIVLFPKTFENNLQATDALNRLFTHFEIELPAYTTADPLP